MSRANSTVVVILTLAMAAWPLGAPAKAARSPEVRFSRPLFEKVEVFLGGVRGSYVLRDAPVARSLGEALTGPPDPNLAVGAGLIVSGCRLHSCDEKGAILLGRAGEVEAIALVSYPCVHRRKPGPGCVNAPVLSVFLPHSPQADRRIRAMTDWAAGFSPRKPIEIVWLHRHPRKA